MRGGPDQRSDQPRHGTSRRPWLIAGAAFLLVFTLGLIALALHPTPDPTTATSTTPTASSATSTASPSASGSRPSSSPSVDAGQPSATPSPATDVDGTPTPAAAITAGRFVDAWLSPGTPAQRRARLAPVTAPSLLAGLVQTDPAVLPTATRVGAVEFDGGGDDAGIYRVRLSDKSAVLVDMVTNGTGGWQAISIQPDPDS